VATNNIGIRLAVVDGQKVKAELRDVGETGQRALKRIEDAAEPASRALQMLDGAAGEVRGTMEGMTERLGAVGGALSALGPVGIAAGAALAAVGAGLAAGIQEAAEAERSYRRLEAVLNATGHASGLTGQQITEFAEGIESSTLTTVEAVQEAAAVLATFRSISGETFTRTLALAQDMATVFGGDLGSAAMQLGKALEDPEQGLTALRRVGISFTQSQRDVIQALIDTGQQAEAQRVILDALERQVGGAGAAEAGGLTGATNRLSDAWNNFLEQLGQTPAIAGFVEGALNTISNAIETVTGMLAGARVAVIEGRLTLASAENFEAQIAEQQRRMAETQEQLAKPGAIGIRGATLRSQLEAQQKELADLERQRDEAMATRKAEQEKALAGKRAAEAEARTERLAGLRDEIEKGLTQHATAAEKRAAPSTCCWTGCSSASRRMAWSGGGASSAPTAPTCWPLYTICTCSSWWPRRFALRWTIWPPSYRTGCARSPGRSGSSAMGAGSRTIACPSAGRRERRSPLRSAQTGLFSSMLWTPRMHRLRPARSPWWERCARCGGYTMRARGTGRRAGGPAPSCRPSASGCSRPTTPRRITARSGRWSGRATRCTSPRPATRMPRIWSRTC
jgi:hypothetical protein